MKGSLSKWASGGWGETEQATALLTDWPRMLRGSPGRLCSAICWSGLSDSRVETDLTTQRDHVA